ncbi:MAG: cellulase family glycosylhydrolase [Chloroflexi bacterium]|nr:cellulase family glycosylhydrolase [Chloroflexota bacterium]
MHTLRPQTLERLLARLVLVLLALGSLASSSPPGAAEPNLQPQSASAISVALAAEPVHSLGLSPAEQIPGLSLPDLLGVQLLSSGALDAAGTAVHAAGARFIHFGIEWRSLAGNTPAQKKLPAAYDWTYYDHIVDTAVGQGYSIMVTLGGNPCWAADYNRGPVNHAPLSDFVDYVDAVVNRYEDRVDYWAVYNEPDVVSFTRAPGSPDCRGDFEAAAFGDHPADYFEQYYFDDYEVNVPGYVSTLQAAYQKIKAIDADAYVLLGGLADDFFSSGIFNPDFLDQILTLDAADSFDVMNYHYYPDYDSYWQGLTGLPGFLGKAKTIRDMLTAHGVVKPLVVSELGDSSGGIYPGDPRTPDTQAQQVIRQFARAAAAGIQIGIWYNMHDYNSTGDSFIHHGLVTSDTAIPPYDPKPSLSAYATLAGVLPGQVYVRPLASTEMGASNLEGYLFRDYSTGHELRLFWGLSSGSQTFHPPAHVESLVDKYGTDVPVTPTITLTQDPLIMISDFYSVYLPSVLR